MHVYREFYPPLVYQPTSPQSQEAAFAAPASVPFLALVVAALLPSPQLKVEAGGGRPHLQLELAKEQKVQEQMMGLQQELGRLEQEGWQGSGQVSWRP